MLEDSCDKSSQPRTLVIPGRLIDDPGVDIVAAAEPVMRIADIDDRGADEEFRRHRRVPIEGVDSAGVVPEEVIFACHRNKPAHDRGRVLVPWGRMPHEGNHSLAIELQHGSETGSP